MPREDTEIPDELYHRVRRCVAKAADCRLEKVGPDSELTRDLGIDGDEAIDFLNAFSSDFGVDLSRMPHGEYFGPEGLPFGVGLLLFAGGVACLVAWSVAWWLGTAPILGCLAFGVVWQRTHPLAALSVRHLAIVAKRGIWVDPPRGEADPEGSAHGG